MAWAFLKPVPSRQHSNLTKRLRLQLYKPQQLVSKLAPDESEVWKWWSQCLHVKYPSSLYVTVEPVNPPEQTNLGMEYISEFPALSSINNDL